MPAFFSRRRKSVSFRTSLLRNLIFLILTLSIAILSASVLQGRRAVRTLCRDLVRSGTDRVESDLRQVFQPVPSMLHAAQGWSRIGLIDIEDPESLNELFTPMLKTFPQLGGLSIAYSDGSGYMLARTLGGYRNQIVLQPGATSRWVEWQNLDGDRSETVVNDKYDPRVRPWYLIATEEEAITQTIFWTEPYTFFTTKLPGITASIRIHDSQGRTGVLSLDIYLEDVTRLSSSIEVSPHGFIVVTTPRVSTIGLPRHPELSTSEARRSGFLKHPRDLGIPLFAEAARQIQDRFNIPDGEMMSEHHAQNQPFRWSFERAQWWTYFRPFRMEEGPDLWMGVAVPENDFLHELKEGRLYSAGIALGGLLLAALLSIHLSKRYSSAISTLIRQSERLRMLDTKGSEENLTEIREIAQLHDAQERMRLALDSFARYVPSDVVRELLEKGEAAVIGGRNTHMSILFTDIEGFTSIAESMPPSDLTEHMATYFDAMIGVITHENGTVDKLIGDAIVAFWSAPKPNPHHARDSVQAAWQCWKTLEPLNEAWERQRLPRLPTRFGISTGDVVVGNVGASNRLSYTAIGDAMNLAARLESANKFYGTRILASQATMEAAGDEFAWRRIDRVRVKGRLEPEMIYELLGETHSVSDSTLHRSRTYESALESYLCRDFARAGSMLENLGPLDGAENRLLIRCQQAQSDPPTENWDGTSEFQEK